MRIDELARRTPLSRRALLLGAAGLAGAVALGGCGSATTPASQDAGPPRPGGRLRVALAGQSPSADVLDPHVAGSAAAGAIAKNVWDRLVAYENDLTLRYRLAESLEPNADGTEWRITLRPGVKFSDGSPLTSRDVLYSIERMLDPAKPSSADLSMVDPARSRADGDLAVQVALSEPLADLGSVLAGWYVYVVKEGSDTFDASSLPVGTGPFVLREWSPGDRALLVRYPEYWDGVAHLDEVEILQIAEPQARVNALRSGEVDMIDQTPALHARTLADEGTFRLVEPRLGTMAALQMRADTPPFDDVRVRQALRMAVDRQAMADTVYLGFAEVGNDLYGLGAPFYAGDIAQRAHDPAGARELLRQAGQENLTVTLTTADSSPGQLDSATLFAEQARESGITVNLETVPADNYAAQVSGQRAFTHNNWWNYSLDYFYGQTTTSDAPGNAGWRNPEWDAKFVTARGTLDVDERAALYAELQQTLWDSGGLILHNFVKQPVGIAPTVQDVPEFVLGNDDWANYRGVWLSE
ncbi:MULTISPECIES: ABC transporter substrate-binding protein [Pseudonocardia]|uniref:Glutathione-binding protein GsiB n=2 Tax=Pseudonocardia TaxID=1847 RepID=A0A1Y2N9A9_PSEAH|nr:MULTISPECIES: ABC transporter substrate-binding protein [Pseudonocardia]OSY44054.1 Glutathione-binding protein GsiB precursor [Pseudonocardia autotrophica]TDN74216.1 peptide/nickel transport system substrate-binding protein [Pseudonocardia autotrophica]BBG04976.1 ABC transporter substrate-binding protein [Pseudonocardia autotrophica]GEC23632.1 ABC transporter substrate-binding protein [Pseudonocardia saturnea]